MTTPSCGYQGTTIDELLGSVDRAFAKADFSPRTSQSMASTTSTKSTTFSSGSGQPGQGDAPFRPVGVGATGRATAGEPEGAHFSGAGCAPSDGICPDCREVPEIGGIYTCIACNYRGCITCFNHHLEEPHWTDGAASHVRESAVKG